MSAPLFRPVLLPDRTGYAHGEERIEGFRDAPDLEVEDRRRIARWARRFAPQELSEVQRELLAGDAGPTVSIAQQELLADQADAQTAWLQGLYELLSGEEHEWISDPSSHPEMSDRTYPLSVGDLATLTGATERQVRMWADQGLLRSFRRSGHRRFYSGALVRAFALARASQHEKAAVSQLSQGDPRRLLGLFAATLGQMAETLGSAAAAEVRSVAEGLFRVGEVLQRRDSPTGDETLEPPVSPELVAASGKTAALSFAPTTKGVGPEDYSEILFGMTLVGTYHDQVTFLDKTEQETWRAVGADGRLLGSFTRKDAALGSARRNLKGRSGVVVIREHDQLDAVSIRPARRTASRSGGTRAKRKSGGGTTPSAKAVREG